MVKKIIGSISLLMVASVSHATGLVMTPPASPILNTQQFTCQASNNHPTKTAEVRVQVIDFNGDVIQEKAQALAPMASMWTVAISGGVFSNDLPARCKISASNVGSKRLAGSALITDSPNGAVPLRLDVVVPAVPVPE